jgi:anti-anti-sigma factor
MQLNTTIRGETAVLGLNGRFDFNDHRTLKSAYDALLQNGEIKIIQVDLKDVSYLDSSALGMLMLLRERAEAVGKSVELCNPNTSVAQILDIANFAKIFTIR